MSSNTTTPPPLRKSTGSWDLKSDPPKTVRFHAQKGDNSETDLPRRSRAVREQPKWPGDPTVRASKAAFTPASSAPSRAPSNATSNAGLTVHIWPDLVTKAPGQVYGLQRYQKARTKICSEGHRCEPGDIKAAHITLYDDSEIETSRVDPRVSGAILTAIRNATPHGYTRLNLNKDEFRLDPGPQHQSSEDFGSAKSLKDDWRSELCSRIEAAVNEDLKSEGEVTIELMGEEQVDEVLARKPRFEDLPHMTYRFLTRARDHKWPEREWKNYCELDGRSWFEKVEADDDAAKNRFLPGELRDLAARVTRLSDPDAEIKDFVIHDVGKFFPLKKDQALKRHPATTSKSERDTYDLVIRNPSQEMTWELKQALKPCSYGHSVHSAQSECWDGAAVPHEKLTSLMHEWSCRDDTALVKKVFQSCLGTQAVTTAQRDEGMKNPSADLGWTGKVQGEEHEEDE